MATTTHLGITLLEQSQAQKEITVNEALARIDALLNSGAIDRDLNTPPVSPAEGDVYIVGASPTGSWSGKARQVAYFDQIWRFIAPNEGLLVWLNDENQHVVFDGTNWQAVITSGGGGGGGSTGPQPMVCEGRLTLTSNTPVTTSDVTAATTLFFTPFRGSRVALYSGTAWNTRTFSQLSIAVPATANTMYDVWAFDNAGTVSLELTAWSNDTTRATALAMQDGVYVRSSAATRRYLGSFRTTAVSGQTEDSSANRFVWNYHHRVPRVLRPPMETADSWVYTVSTWRQANANTANQLNFIIGVSEDMVTAQVMAAASSTQASTVLGVSLGLDTTSSPAAGNINPVVRSQVASSSAFLQCHALWSGYPGVGRHYLAWLEFSGATGTTTWLGDGGGTAFFAGMQGSMHA